MTCPSSAAGGDHHASSIRSNAVYCDVVLGTALRRGFRRCYNSGMSRKSQVLAQRDRIREIAASCNAESISLFGSVARGEDTPNSDCDFIADIKPKTTLLHLARMTVRLEDLLGCDVDVVTRCSVPPGSVSVENDEILL